MFDLDKLLLNKKKSEKFIKNSPLIRFIHEDFIDRLQLIDNEFKEILLIRPLIKEILIDGLKAKYPNHNLTIIEEYSQAPEHKFNLIIFAFGLHWVNNVEKFLYLVNKSLKPNGVFMANFPGGGSLQKLRYKLMELEAKNSMSHAPHISPFIKFEHLSPLLKQAGFVENIIDEEILELEHESAFDLMKMLKNIGESNVLSCASSYSITESMYQELKQKQQEGFNDQINLISFISSPSKGSVRVTF